MRTRPFGSPCALRLRSLPHMSCVSIVFFLFRPCAHCAPLHVPSHRARVLPSIQFICVPMAYVSAARPCALVRTVFHIPSPLPLSRDANPLVTSICCVQLGCSGHPHTHIPYPHPLLSWTVDDLTPSHTYLASIRSFALISRSKTHQRTFHHCVRAVLIIVSC